MSLSVGLSEIHVSIARRLGKNVSEGIRQAFVIYYDSNFNREPEKRPLNKKKASCHRTGISITSADAKTAEIIGDGVKARGIRIALEFSVISGY